MKKIELDFFIHLRNIIINSLKYNGNKIVQIDVLNIVYYELTDFEILNKYIQEQDFISLINYDYDSENALELLEIIIIKDVNNHFYFGCLIDPSDLFSDKYLYEIYQIKQEDYNLLVKSKNHKGLFKYLNE